MCLHDMPATELAWHAQAIQGKTSVCLGLLAALRNAGLKAAMLGRDRGGTTAVRLLGLGG